MSIRIRVEEIIPSSSKDGISKEFTLIVSKHSACGECKKEKMEWYRTFSYVDDEDIRPSTIAAAMRRLADSIGSL